MKTSTSARLVLLLLLAPGCDTPAPPADDHGLTVEDTIFTEQLRDADFTEGEVAAPLNEPLER